MVGSFSLSLESEFLSVLSLTLTQSFLSALLSLVLGFVGALGLLHLEQKYGVSRKILDGVALLPNFVPPVFLIVAALSQFGASVRGWSGVLLLHTMMNAGLVSFILMHALQRKAAHWARLAQIEGSNSWNFWRRGGLEGMKSEFYYAFLFVFALCFTSFSIPMALGSNRLSLEIHIFELVRVQGDWPAALGVGLFQSVSLVFLSLFIPKFYFTKTWDTKFPQEFTLSWGWIVPALPVVLLAINFFKSWLSLSEFTQTFAGLWGVLGTAALGSLIVATGVGWGAVLLFLWMSRFPPAGLTRRVLLGSVAPSATLFGMVLLFFVPFMSPGWDFFRMIAGLLLLVFPALYRMELDGVLQDLQKQRAMAEILGADSGLTFREIVFPQVVRVCGRLAGIAALWAWGDFAFTSLVSSERKTLATLILSLMESYRFDVASLLLTVLLVGGLLSYSFFSWMGNVLTAKS